MKIYKLTHEEIDTLNKLAEKYAKKHEKIINYHHDEPETNFEDIKNAYIAGATFIKERPFSALL